MTEVHYVAPLLAALVLAGCGAAETVQPRDERPSDPSQPERNREPDMDRPPVAFVETSDGRRALGYGSYCWGSACADSVGPRCGSSWTPTVRVERGERVRFVLGFVPTEVELSVYHGSPREPAAWERPLPAAQEIEWRAEREGGLWLAARERQGRDVAYIACIVLD